MSQNQDNMSDFKSFKSSFHVFSSSGSALSSESSSTALNFLVALTTADIRIYTAATLNLVRTTTKSAGSGGFSTVDIGRTIHGQVVAVKHSRILSEPMAVYNEEDFERHLSQLCLELRILTQVSLASHSHIVNILGLCVDDYSGDPSLSLVLEYSALGDLQAFLLAHQGSLSSTVKLDLCNQIGSGIRALHDLKICHGDVKLANCLIFHDDDKEWQVKLSDFGQSVVQSHTSPSTCSGFPHGTQLYNAPEIRVGSANVGQLGIEESLRTDIFSFGLLVWELLKDGRCYFDAQWLDSPEESTLETMVAYLDELPEEALSNHAICCLENLHLDTSQKETLEKVFQQTLQGPGKRATIVYITDLLELEESYIKNLDQLEALTSWSNQQSLYEVLDSGLENGVLLDDLPFSIQERAISELQNLFVNKDMPPATRAHTAMTLSECYAIGFGVQIDETKVAESLLFSATYYNPKAVHFYPRVCQALGFNLGQDNDAVAEIFKVEAQLSNVPTEEYLKSRINLFMSLQQEQSRQDLSWLSPTGSSNPITIKLFNDQVEDHISVLHMAALSGDINLVERALSSHGTDVLSTQGFSAVHFACIGASIPVLKLLLQHGAPADIKSAKSITPLHVSLFFAESELSTAIDLLTSLGVSTEDESDSIKFDSHDITLYGTPLDWAILTRNSRMVQELLPRTQKKSSCLQIALSQFFPDILEQLIQITPSEPLFLNRITRPFSHWIAHGSDRFDAITKTMQLCHKHNLISVECDPIEQPGYTQLMHMVNSARSIDDLKVIEELLSFMSPLEIKQVYGPDRFSALIYAIGRAGHNNKWAPILRKIVQIYTVDELQERCFMDNSYLHQAIIGDSIIGARVLLETGVNVSQPTFDEHQETALHLCMTCQASTEMHDLLIEFGADPNIRDSINNVTPLLAGLTGRQRTAKLLDLALEQQFSSEETWIETLHRMLEISISSKNNTRSDWRRAFKHMISTENGAKYINQPDSHGLTLLHRAAFHLDLESVQTLLEANADACLPISNVQPNILPLQIVCAVGRLFWASYLSGNQAIFAGKEDRLMNLASLLLEWHRENIENPFKGISTLHLASHMAMKDEIRVLLGNGLDPLQKGSWPSLEDQVTPEELQEAELEYDILALQMIKPYDIEDEILSAATQAPAFDPDVVRLNGRSATALLHKSL